MTYNFLKFPKHSHRADQSTSDSSGKIRPQDLLKKKGILTNVTNMKQASREQDMGEGKSS